MTFAEFIAVCFWPLVILFGLLLATTKDPLLRRSIAIAAVAIGFIYFGLGVFYARSSIIAVVDFYLLMGLFGCMAIIGGYNRLRSRRPSYPPKSLKERLADYSLIVLGGGFIWLAAITLYPDFVQPRLVLEGRVENLRTPPRRHRGYLVDIAGQTVEATTPVYERLKFKPYVRVEVGRGSNYIYRIEYLSN